MRMRIVIVVAMLLIAVQISADSKTERHWHPAQVREIQRTPTRLSYVIDDGNHIYRQDALTERNKNTQWPFLSDPERKVQKDLDIQEYTHPEHNPMIPHTLVLKPGLVIYSMYNGYWFWGRPSVIDLWHDLRRNERNPPRPGSGYSWTPRSLECG